MSVKKNIQINSVYFLRGMAEELFAFSNTALTLAHDMHFYVSLHTQLFTF